MSPVIAYAIHGRGMGHASRARAMVTHLRQCGYQVRVFAGGDAITLLKDHEPQLEVIESVSRGLSGAGVWWRRSQSDRKRLRETKASLLVTDGDGPSLWSARKLGLPTIAIGHSLVFGRTDLPDTPRLARNIEAINAASSSWKADRKLAIHFVPARPLYRDTRVARPDLSELQKALAPYDQPPKCPSSPLRILSYFRDNNGEAVLRCAAQWGAKIIHFGHLAQKLPGVECRPLDRQSFLAELMRCAAVFASSGSNLIAESICAQKPILSCYRKGDHEQSMNAQIVQRAKVGHAFCFSNDPKSAVTDFLIKTSQTAFATIPLLDAMQPASELLLESVDSLLGRSS